MPFSLHEKIWSMIFAETYRILQHHPFTANAWRTSIWNWTWFDLCLRLTGVQVHCLPTKSCFICWQGQQALSCPRQWFFPICYWSSRWWYRRCPYWSSSFCGARLWYFYLHFFSLMFFSQKPTRKPASSFTLYSKRIAGSYPSTLSRSLWWGAIICTRGQSVIGKWSIISK